MRADPVGDGAHVRREVPGDGGRIEQGEILVVYGTEAAEGVESDGDDRGRVIVDRT